METPPAVRLANDIAMQFEMRTHDEAVDAIANHIAMFWEPRMRTQLIEFAGVQHVDLSDLAYDAARSLRNQGTR